MKSEFTISTKVRFNIPGGARARITNYTGNGFYEIVTIPERRELVAHEDDLVLGWSEEGEDVSTG